MAKFRVLALDGGGVRGIFTTMLLRRLASQPGLAHAFDHADLIAGNSSGGLIALALAKGFEQPGMLATLIGLEQAFDDARQVFGRPRLPWLPWLGWVFCSKYRTGAREDRLKQLLGENTRLKDLKKNVLISSFDLDNEGLGDGRVRGVRLWKPKLFHNFVGANSDRELLAWKVALSTTAAVTYFPSVDGFVDGGLYANNPSMCALAQVFDARYAPNPKPPLDDVLLLSVGAGQNLFHLKGKTVKWGLVRWANRGRFVEAACDGTVGVADYECRQMLTDNNYRRLAPDLGRDIEVALDGFECIDYLKQHIDSPEVTEEIMKCAQWMREHWMAGVTDGPILPEVTSKHVGTATELTCLMPIRAGFLPVLDTCTYASRLRTVFQILQQLRVASREILAIKPVLDIVDAAGTVHAFSWTIVEERQLLLSVTFDRPWEPYIRIIWRNLGPLLDFILCNCEGYVPTQAGFGPFVEWVRRHQIDTGFFYPASSLTVQDQTYLARLEKLHRDGAADFEIQAATLLPNGPVVLAENARDLNPAEAIEQWLAVLDVLYGLRTVYPDDSADHVFLLRAARALLDPSRPKNLPASLEIEWFDRDRDACAPMPDRRQLDRHDVQGGILEPYRKVSHGCLLLARVDDASAARQFIGRLVDSITRGDDPAHGPDRRERRDDATDGVLMNVAFTFNGLKHLGVRSSDLARFPKEFRESMEARAGLLGDVHENHPEQWTLPEWNAGAQAIAQDQAPRIRTSTVDIVIALYKREAWDNADYEWGSTHPLYSEVHARCEEARQAGVTVLSVQPVRRLSAKRKDGQVGRLAREHFGFLDGISQPIGSDEPDPNAPDEVEMGEVFVGFQNERGDPAFPEKSPDQSVWARGSLIDAGSFLVVRKLRQDVSALRAVLPPGKDARDLVLAKMMGRLPDGTPLATPGPTGIDRNDFDFDSDRRGAECPFHAHIRRGNPRLPKPREGEAQSVIPRIVRRGLAYGPTVKEVPPKETDTTEPTDTVDRGMIFMAYNASIAEQFEIIQRWMSGGNTPARDGNSGVFSGQPDPFLGLPDADGRRTYLYLDHDCPRRVDLRRPLVTLQWGLYLFAPSIPALRLLARDPETDLLFQQTVVDQGVSLIQNLSTVDDWAAVLEDISANVSGATAAVFAAIRAVHGGVLRTPYGVIVASRDLAMKVFSTDPAYSVREYQNRFAVSVGKNYLGMDRGAAYDAESYGPNEALKKVDERRAFDDAYHLTQQALKDAIHLAMNIDGRAAAAANQADPFVQVPLEPVVDIVLAKLAQKWFDIPDGTLIKVGGQPEKADDLHCPFSFLAPSRFVFSSPNPRDAVIELGEDHGQRLLDKTREFVRECRERERVTGSLGLHGEISRDLFDRIRDNDDLLARTLLGLVFGFVPTVYGNALQTLGSWLDDESLWRVQQRVLAANGGVDYAAACVLRRDLEHAMLAHPVPQLLHRTVTTARSLGGVALKPGDRVVLGMSGITQDDGNQGRADIPAVAVVFGGYRKAVEHPTHACPGYDIAMGTLLGLLSAVMFLGRFSPGSGVATIRVPRPGRSQPSITTPSASDPASPESAERAFRARPFPSN
jgi:deferrochelatase/peroxidase EfeB